MNRRGVTLVELLIGLVLLAVLGLAITQTLMATSRAAVRSMQSLATFRTLVAAGALVREELGNSDTSEVRLANTEAVDFGRTVGTALVCDSHGRIVRLPASGWLGHRWPEGGRDDAVLLTDASSSRWSTVPIVAVSSGQCPDGSDAILLMLESSVDSAVFVRIAEPVQLRLYLAGGSGWWGLAPASGLSPVQPFAGPIEPPLQAVGLTAAGLALAFRPLHGLDALMQVPLGGSP